MKTSIFLTVMLFITLSTAKAQDTAPKPEAVKATQTQPVAPKTLDKKAPDADWMAEFDQATALQATIAKEQKDAGIDKLQNLLESLSRDLINKIPKGYHFDQNAKQFVADAASLPTTPTTPDKPETPENKDVQKEAK